MQPHITPVGRPVGSAQRVLITGGAGFIGSHLSELLLDAGHTVTVVDNFSTGRRANPGIVRSVAARSERYHVIEGEVSDIVPSLSTSDYDCIYHLAAAVGVRLVVEKPIHTIETNIHETSVVLRFAAERRTPILIASTSEVYGKGVRVPMREDDDVVYGSTSFSRWCYACSKAIDEYLALAYHREQGLPAVIVRFFNTVGRRPDRLSVHRYGRSPTACLGREESPSTGGQGGG